MSSSDRSVPLYFWVRLTLGVLTALAAGAAALHSLPAFFMALAAVMAMLALTALFHSLRIAFGDREGVVGLRAALPGRAALIDEKNVLLRAIKDIGFEREVGKLSDADYTRLDRAYRLRAKEVLRKLDEDLAPYLARAERVLTEGAAAPSSASPFVDAITYPSTEAPKKKKRSPEGANRTAPAKSARRTCVKCGTQNGVDAEWCKECGASVVPRECPACGATNEPDAKFCIKCAGALVVASEPSESEESP